jgi:exonuclease SbcC
MSWKSLFGSADLTELPEELAELLAQSKRDSEALRELLERSDTATKKFESLVDPLEAMQATAKSLTTQMSDLQARADSFDGRTTALGESVSRFEEVSGQVEKDQKSVERSFESVSKRLAEADAKVSELDDALQSVGLVKQELVDFVGPNGALAKVRAQVEEAREQSLGCGKEVAQIQEDQAGIRAAQESVSSQYRDLRSKLESIDEGVDKANANVARVEKAKLDLTKAEELGARTERQLSSLQALSDHIVQKTGAVERQREALDRTEAQARALTDLHWELEAKLKEAKTQIKDLKKVHASVDDLRSINAKVAARTSELRAEQTEVERESKTLRAGLAGLQEQMRRTTKRFELEQSTLEADGQRVIALRADVTDLENRLRGLEETGATVNEASRRVDDMSARLTSLSGELGRISEQVELVEGMREGMSEAQRTALDVTASLSSLEARQAGVQDSMDDLRTLRGAGEEVAGALETLRATRSEIDRLQTEQAETGAWLAGTHESMRELRTKVAQIEDLTANIDRMRENADRVVAAASDLDERRESFDELEVRMSVLQQIGTKLDERTSNLLEGLVDADNRFKAVARNAEKADEVRETIEEVVASVRQAEQRMAELGDGVDSAAERAEGLTLLSQRADRVIADIRRGEKSLSKAVEQLESVSTLRKEGAEAVQSLEDQIRVVKEGLVIAEEQSDQIGQRADLLEARAGSLRFAEKRITRFEEKLAELDGVEQELAQSIETLLARQEGVSQVRSDVQELFATTERTLADVRAISAARDEVQSAAEVLEEVRAKAEVMTEALDGIEVRQQQIAQSEVRLERADALLREIRSSLESMTSQRAVVDRVLATSGRLSVEAREAEGLPRHSVKSVN